MASEPNLDVEIAVRIWRRSSNIEAVGYHGASRTMEVRFKGGGRYRYGDVDLVEAAPLLTEIRDPRLMPDETPGKYLSRVFVRNEKAHPFAKIR